MGFVLPGPGNLIAGKYAIVRVVGEGGMGIVYEAMHQRLRQRVALKMLLPPMLEHEVIVSRFEREARAAARLRGRHVARVKDVDVTPEGLPYMVMDFLEGHDLSVEIERRGRLPVGETVDYVLQACAAMVEAHALGIVHRDLKPSNLFLEHEPDHTGYVVKVLDFGISKLAASEGDAKLTTADTVMGTAMYMSPEQLRDSGAVDARADIWALGIILYEALTGRVPFMGQPTQVAAMIVSEDAPELQSLCDAPSELAAIVRKAMQRRPQDRFADVKELAAALVEFAPKGSVGRAFGESVAPGSYPRIVTAPITKAFDSSGSIGKDDDDAPPESAKTVLEAPGVRPEMGSVSGWSQQPAASRGRAAIAGVAVAVVVVLLSIGAVFVFARRTPPAPNVAAVAAEASISKASTTLPAMSEAPPVAASEPPPAAVVSATATALAVRTAPPAKAAPTASTAPSAQPAAKPAAKPAASADKPLFL